MNDILEQGRDLPRVFAGVPGFTQYTRLLKTINDFPKEPHYAMLGRGITAYVLLAAKSEDVSDITPQFMRELITTTASLLQNIQLAGQSLADITPAEFVTHGK